MGVSLPSDLIADVMRNADPSRLKGAVANLQSMGEPTDSGTAFASVLEAQPERWGGGMESLFSPVSTAVTSPDAPASRNAYAGFEQMVLRNLLEQLLPAAESGTFGTGTSAAIWRSMAADQLASVYAQAGGVGIGSMLAQHEAHGLAQAPTMQWPYFSTSEIRAFTG